MRRIKPGVLGRLKWAVRQHRHGRPARSTAGRIRLLWHDFVTHVLFEGGERCQDCGRDHVLWHAENDLYRHVHGSSSGLLCPGCFDRQAREKGLVLDWRPVILRNHNQETA